MKLKADAIFFSEEQKAEMMVSVREKKNKQIE
jgi:hypothetical protein